MRLLQLLPLASLALAAPAPIPIPVAEPKFLSPRDTPTIPSQITTSSQIADLAAGLEQQLWATSQAPIVLSQLISAIVPNPSPLTIADYATRLKEFYTTNHASITESALNLLLTGLTPKNIISYFEVLPQSNSLNVNLRIPWPPIYPRAESSDPKFSILEAQLKAAIYIPPEFTYGKKPPVILVPGTASKAGNAFGPNVGKLLKGKDWADVVYLNIPGFNLGDIQKSKFNTESPTKVEVLDMRIVRAEGVSDVVLVPMQELLC